MKREDFLKEVERITYIANELARLHSSIDGGYPERGPSFGPEGVTFYRLEPEQYGDGEVIAESTVPWAEIDDFITTTARLKKEIADHERARAQAAKDWQRKEYERLKAVFEKKP